jgi:hypothetical protein
MNLAVKWQTVRTKSTTTIHKQEGGIKMGRMRENPRYNVISMRISDEEREHLENIMGQTQRSISDIMREAMEYFAANYGQIEAQRRAA